MNLGSGEKGEFTFLDIITLVSFIIGLQNLDANLDQNDKQELQQDLADKAENLLFEIHAHLEEQDKKLDLILKNLEVLYDSK